MRNDAGEIVLTRRNAVRVVVGKTRGAEADITVDAGAGTGDAQRLRFCGRYPILTAHRTGCRQACHRRGIADRVRIIDQCGPKRRVRDGSEIGLAFAQGVRAHRLAGYFPVADVDGDSDRIAEMTFIITDDLRDRRFEPGRSVCNARVVDDVDDQPGRGGRSGVNCRAARADTAASTAAGAGARIAHPREYRSIGLRRGGRVMRAGTAEKGPPCALRHSRRARTRSRCRQNRRWQRCTALIGRLGTPGIVANGHWAIDAIADRREMAREPVRRVLNAFGRRTGAAVGAGQAVLVLIGIKTKAVAVHEGVAPIAIVGSLEWMPRLLQRKQRRLPRQAPVPLWVPFRSTATKHRHPALRSEPNRT